MPIVHKNALMHILKVNNMSNIITKHCPVCGKKNNLGRLGRPCGCVVQASGVDFVDLLRGQAIKMEHDRRNGKTIADDIRAYVNRILNRD